MKALLLKALTSKSSDVVLAIIGLAITQYRIIDISESWQHARLALPVFVALGPALIAIRRVDPVLASIGLAAGSVGSLLLGQVSWVLVVGCMLAVWSVPSVCRLGTSIATLVGATLALVAGGKWLTLLNWTYTTFYNQQVLDDGTVETTTGISQVTYERIRDSNWQWWLAVPVLLVGLGALIYRQRRAATDSYRTAGQRLDDVRVFLLDTNRAWVLDTMLAFVAVSAILLEIRHDQAVGNWWSAPGWMPVAIAYSAVSLTLRRRWPVVPVVLLTISAMLAYWQMTECWTVLAALAIALYSLTVCRSLLFSLPIATVVLAAAPVLAALVRYPQMVLIFPALKNQPLSSGDIHDPPDNIWHNTIYEDMVDRQWPVILSLVLMLLALVGVLVRLYRRNRTSAAREAELEQRAEEQDAAQVVLTERSYIARDLHDVVAHAVNLMVIQAETGPDLLERGDAEVLAGFQRIGDAGRRALGELDRMLSALRDSDGLPDPALIPQPGLAELPQLVQDVSHELVVDLEMQGDPDGPPEGHQLTAYRLVQEALTNVVRHAGATKVIVTVDIGADEVLVEVADDGHGFDLDVARRGGRHGLAGMRERVRIHDGSLGIDSAPGRGTTVSARIPVTKKEIVAE